MKFASTASYFASTASYIATEDLSADDLARDASAVLPRLHGALLKNEQDVHLFERLAFMARSLR